MKIFVWSIISIVAVAIITGFFIVGSPQEERLRRFDERRVQDLQMIQGEIVNYWQNKKKLPLALTDLRDDIRGVAIPEDPVTKLSYEYNTVNSLTFSLCAIFARSNNISSYRSISPPSPYVVPMKSFEDVWTHHVGHVCFERTIDPEIYKKTS